MHGLMVDINQRGGSNQHSFLYSCAFDMVCRLFYLFFYFSGWGVVCKYIFEMVFYADIVQHLLLKCEVF